MTNYPAKIDTDQSLPSVVDNRTPVQAVVFNRLRDTIITIEEELGITPSGIYGSVAARLNVLEGITGNLQIIELQRDLGGTLENPLVVGIMGLPLSTAYPQKGDALFWDGLAWGPSNALSHAFFFANGDLSGDGYSQEVVGLRNRPIGVNAPNVGDSIIWDGAQWNPAPAFTAGGDLTGSSTVQTVAFLQGIQLVANTPSAGQVLTFNGSFWNSQYPAVPITNPPYFVWQPGGGGGGPILYDDFASLVNARLSIPGPCTIVVDFSFTSIAATDGGTFNMGGNTKFVTYNGGANTGKTLQIQQNTTILNPNEFEGFGDLKIYCPPNAGGSPAYSIEYDTYTPILKFINCSISASYGGGTHGPIDAGNGNLGLIQLYGNTVITPVGGLPVINALSQQAFIEAYDAVTIDNSTIDGSAGVQISLYGSSASCSSSQSGPVTVLGVDLFPDFAGASVGAIPIKTGPGTATWAVPDVGPTQFVYQPGGSLIGPVVYNSWTSLMNARNSIVGPAVIAIDDVFQSPAVIDTGTWELFGRTTLVGLKGGTYPRGFPGQSGSAGFLTQVSLPNTCHLINPHEFRDLTVIGKSTSTPSITAGAQSPTPNVLAVKAYNTIFTVDPTASQPLFRATNADSYFDLYESSSFANPGTNGSFVLSDASTLTSYQMQINMYDGSNIDILTIQTPAIGAGLTVNSIGLGTRYATQTTVLGVLNGYVTQDYGGTGSKAYIPATELKMGVAAGADGSTRVDSFVNFLNTTTNGFHTISTIGINGFNRNPSGTSCCDISISLASINATLLGNKFWRCDLTFTAYWNVGVITLYDSTGPITPVTPTNIRSNGGDVISAQAIVSGNQILIQVNSSGSLNLYWNCIGQLQWVI